MSHPQAVVDSTKHPYASTERLLWWVGRTLGAAERLGELGYTGVVTRPGVEWKTDLPVWVHLQSPAVSPFADEYPDAIFERLESLEKGAHGILWEVPYQRWEGDRDYTDYDLLLRQLQTVEAATDLPLIFYPSAKDPRVVQRMAQWLEDLALDVGAGTTLAFSAVAGLPTDDHLPLHPFWQRISTMNHAPLMPIVNVGAVEQGESLWPTYTDDRVAEVAAHATGPGFLGWMALAPSVPNAGCVLDANLWVAAQAFAGGRPASLLLEEWMRAQELLPSEELPIARRVRRVHLQLRELLAARASGEITDAEPERVRVQSLLGQLNEIALDSGETGGIRPLLPYFVRDSKRLLYQHMQANNISIPNVFSGDDMQESFWTQMAGGGSHGISFGSEASLLPEPQRGAPGSVMERAYARTYAE